MAASGTTAKFTFACDDEVSETAKDVAQATAKMRSEMEQSEATIKDLQSSLRKLRGSSEDVKAAKASLTAQLNVERDSLSRNNLALLKQGTSYDKLNAKKREADETSKKLTEANKQVTSTLDPLTSKLGGFKDLLTGATGAEELAAAAMGAAVAAVLALGAAFVYGAVGLAKWIAQTRDIVRTQGLLREAAVGAGSQANNLGDQVDLLASKLPASKAALNDLAVAMAKSGLQGKTLVSTFNAVGQASSALGDDAGAKLKALVERGRVSQRLSIGDDRFSEDLRGSGLKRDDVAAALAKNLKIGINDARMALAQGRVKLADGAKALEDAATTKFGPINLKKMMSLDVIGQKLSDTFAGLTKDVNLEPLLRGFQTLTKVFGSDTESGKALKALITAFGDALGTTFEKIAPYGAEFFRGILISALDLAIGFYKVRNALRDSLGDTKIFANVDGMKVALEAGRLVVTSLAVGFVALAGAAALVAAPFVLAGAAVYETLSGLEQIGESVFGFFKQTDFADLGSRIVDGLVDGLKSGAAKVTDTVKGMATSIKDGFKNALGIHSPSKVFAEFGENTAAGYSKGVERGSGDAQNSVASMVTLPAAPAAGGGRAVNVNLTLNIEVKGGADKKEAEQTGRTIASEATTQIGRALESMFMGTGIPLRG